MKYWANLAKDWGIALVVVFAAFFTWQYINTPNLQSSGAAPDFALENLVGEKVELSSFGDQLVVLNFWFTDCPPCRSEIPQIVDFHDANPDIPVIGISIDRIPTPHLRSRSGQLGIDYTVLHDRSGVVARSYGVTVFPTTMIVSGGEIRSVRVGEIDRAMLTSMVERNGG